MTQTLTRTGWILDALQACDISCTGTQALATPLLCVADADNLIVQLRYVTLRQTTDKPHSHSGVFRMSAPYYFCHIIIVLLNNVTFCDFLGGVYTG